MISRQHQEVVLICSSDGDNNEKDDKEEKGEGENEEVGEEKDEGDKEDNEDNDANASIDDDKDDGANVDDDDDDANNADAENERDDDNSTIVFSNEGDNENAVAGVFWFDSDKLVLAFNTAFDEEISRMMGNRWLETLDEDYLACKSTYNYIFITSAQNEYYPRKTLLNTRLPYSAPEGLQAAHIGLFVGCVLRR